MKVGGAEGGIRLGPDWMAWKRVTARDSGGGSISKFFLKYFPHKQLSFELWMTEIRPLVIKIWPKSEKCQISLLSFGFFGLNFMDSDQILIFYS